MPRLIDSSGVPLFAPGIRSFAIDTIIPKFNTSAAANPEFEKIDRIVDLLTWTSRARKLKGQQFSFENRKHLERLYRSNAKEINVVKPRQMEITEFALNWLLYNLILHPFSIGLYMSDRQDHVSVFSKLRLQESALAQSEYLYSKVRGLDHNVSEQPFTNGSRLYMYSAWGDFEAARSIPVDFAVIDEMQSINVEALPVLKESMSKSQYGRMIKIGTGSDEGDDWYKEWCNGTQLYWEQEAVNTDGSRGAWLQRPHTDMVPGIESYQVSQLMAFWISAESIEQKRKHYSARRFANEVEGWWFKGTRKPILEKEMRVLFDKNIGFVPSEEVDHSLPVYMGVDWGGGTSAYTVPWIWQLTSKTAPRFQLLYVSKITERSTETQADMIANLIDKYKPDRVVIDEGGGARQVEKLSKRYAEGVIKCHFLHRPGDPFEKVSGENRVNVDRTWGIESIIDLIQRPEQLPDFPNPVPRIHIPGRKLEDVEWLIDHFTCIEAESVDTGTGTFTKYTHPEETNDDALMAALYALMAWLYDKNAEWFWVRL